MAVVGKSFRMCENKEQNRTTKTTIYKHITDSTEKSVRYGRYRLKLFMVEKYIIESVPDQFDKFNYVYLLDIFLSLFFGDNYHPRVRNDELTVYATTGFTHKMDSTL